MTARSSRSPYAGTAAVLSPDQLSRVGINNIENLNDVLPGLRVGDDVVIGAGAIVTEDYGTEVVTLSDVERKK